MWIGWGTLERVFESRMCGSEFPVPRGGSSALVASDVFRTLSQCISLEPVVIPEKITWCDEFSRVVGISVRSTAEENSLRAGVAHVKPLTPMTAVKDLKRFRLSVEETCFKARIRENKMDECLRKLYKYCEGVTSKKQKMIYSINQRVEDRPKNILLNKRVRTSVAESRAKDGNLLEDNGGESDLFEKIRRLAAGGEGWDKKIKRKRSVGTFFTRPTNSDEVPKRALQNKVADKRFRSSNRDDSLSNYKRSMPPPGSSFPSMSQWVGQRPQKMARVWRPNLVLLVSNQDENRLSFESHSPSVVGARLTSQGTNGSPISKIATTIPQKLIVKLENFQFPLLLSESQEYVGGQSRLIGKEYGNSEMDAILKNKPLFSAATPKPFQRSKTGHKKNESKPVRRLKKLSDRKGLSRHSPLQNNSSPDCTCNFLIYDDIHTYIIFSFIWTLSEIMIWYMMF